MKLRPNNVFHFYAQDGDKFKEIGYKEFPKSIALKNFFKPGRGELVDIPSQRGTRFATDLLDDENR